jgi:hypothetical protein
VSLDFDVSDALTRVDKKERIKYKGHHYLGSWSSCPFVKNGLYILKKIKKIA